MGMPIVYVQIIIHLSTIEVIVFCFKDVDYNISTV
jgi:hypothetical protein